MPTAGRHPAARRKATATLRILVAVGASFGALGDEPRTTDLVERAEVRLAQVQVTATGPAEVVSALTPEDFKLKVNLRRLSRFELDSHCAPKGTEPTGATYGPATYLLYFDQPHLTMAGRQRALDLARQLVGELIHDGAEAMIVSNSARLAIVQERTADPRLLVEALERLENDRTQWDFFAEREDERIAEIVEVLNKDNDVHRAIAVARSHQRSERFIADKNLRRLAVIVGHLAELPAPKSVLYFADTMRSNPGEHYLTFFGERLRRSSPALGGIATDTLVGGLPFDRVINEASAHGVRLYPVLARGLITPLDRVRTTPNALTQTLALPSSSRLRFRDSQNTMTSMATETGGHAFVRGASARRIAARLREDSSCVYVVSFDPDGFPLDAPLRVIITSRREDVRLRSRGRIVLQSPRARLASRLLGAFSLNRDDDAGLDLSAHLIPTGFDGRRYRALLQIRVPRTTLPSSSWDVGASLLHGDQVRDEIAGHLSVARPDVWLVLEHEVDLRPGPNEIVAVAHESTSGLVLSDHLRIEWPEPSLTRALCGPIALVQPTDGAFMRGRRTRTSGSLARSGAEPVDATKPTAMMSLVCRGGRQKGELSVDRILVGASSVDFPRLAFDLGADRCAQVRDVIPAGTLSPGSYSYEIRIRHGDSELDRASRDFRVSTAQP